MFTNSQAQDLIREAVDALLAGGMIDAHVQIEPNTVLLGAGSPLDSMSFVALMTEIEDRLTRRAGRDVFLLFDDIHAFNPDKSTLTVETLCAFLEAHDGAPGN